MPLISHCACGEKSVWVALMEFACPGVRAVFLCCVVIVHVGPASSGRAVRTGVQTAIGHAICEGVVLLMVRSPLAFTWPPSRSISEIDDNTIGSPTFCGPKARPSLKAVRRREYPRVVDESGSARVRPLGVEVGTLLYLNDEPELISLCFSHVCAIRDEPAAAAVVDGWIPSR